MKKSYKENMRLNDENAAFCVSVLSVIGDRADQQDCFGFSMQTEEGIVVVCDGMGGHAGGQKASNLAVQKLLEDYEDRYPIAFPDLFLEEEVRKIDREIHSFGLENGEPLQAGSTIVSVFIRDRRLYWMSVGDSRLYLYRNGELVRVTQDHIYKTVLDERLSAEEITRVEYKREECRGEALISFLGIGDLQLVDNNTAPFSLKPDDKLLLMSDGLYKLLSDEEIASLTDNFRNISEALQAINLTAEKKAEKQSLQRDNMTVALIRIK